MRNTDIEKLLFSVELRDIYFLSDSKKKRYKKISGKKAVVNKETSEALGTVSDSYKLVPNKDAIHYALECMRLLFRVVNTKDIEVFNIISSKNGSYCHIDMIHKDYKINIFETEVYLPYLRITNSYNTSRALKFDLGFCRELCNNGVIFEKETIKFYFPHTKKDIGKTIKFDIEDYKFKKLEIDFINYMEKIDKIPIYEEYIIPLICKALNLNFDICNKDENKQARERIRLNMFKSEISPIVERYICEMGYNVYSIFNTITDYSSNPDKNRRISSINNLQKKTGDWIIEFLKVYNKSDFNWDKYLNNFMQYN